MEELKNEKIMEEKNDFKPIIIYYIVQFVIGFMAGFVTVSIYGEKGLEKIDSLATIISFASLGIIALLFVIIYRKRVISDIKRLTKKDVITIIVASIGWCILNLLISNIMESLNIVSNNQELIKESLKTSKILITIATVLFAPLAEEFVFRYSFSTFIKNNIAFIIISSIIFGAMHVTNIAIIIYILMGVVFSLVYIKTDKNIIASSIVHMINNLFGVISLFLII